MTKRKPPEQIKPPLYRPELVETILERVADGWPIRKIGRDPAMPDYRTLKRWLRKYEEFQTLYARAKAELMDRYADEMVDIADSNEGDTFVDEDGHLKHDTDHIQRAKLRIDTRKWLMTQLSAKKYGDKAAQNVVANVYVQRLVFTGKEGGEDE